MNNNKIRVAITHGSTNGIGYELIFKAFEETEMFELCTPIIYGSPKVAAYHSKALGIKDNFTIINDASAAQDGKLNIIPAVDEEIKVEMGIPSSDATLAAVKALDRAITDYKDGLFDVLVCAPADKGEAHVGGFDFPRRAKYIEQCIGEGKKAQCLLINGDMRLALMTDQISLKDVPAAITSHDIIEQVAILFTTLRRDMRVSNPRIAVLALNPDVDGKTEGKEETEAIVPAIQKLADAGVNVFGPYQADLFFQQGDYYHFDAILAMYHDQGLAPFKTLHPDNNVRYLGGLPLVATAPDLSPCYDIAGQGVADPTPLRHAIYAAIDGFRNRRAYDEPLANPLPKLYHEKKDDSEKVRFSIPKKHENAIKERLGNHPAPAAKAQEGNGKEQ